MRVTHLRIDNFRCLQGVDLDLSPLTVIIGPNGAGKSSLLQAVGHVGTVAQQPGRLTRFISNCGGFAAALSYHASEPVMRLGLTLAEDSDSLRYDIGLRSEGTGFFVENERLRRQSIYDSHSQDVYRRQDTSAALFSEESGSSSVQVPHGPEADCFKHESRLPDIRLAGKVLDRVSRWKADRFQPRDTVRRPQQLQPTELPLNDGTDLFAALYSMQTDREARFAELLETLRLAVPELTGIDFPLAGAGHVNLRWQQSDFAKPLYANQLSDGTLRLLWLLTVLHAVPDDGLVLLDEPELSLHPQWLMLLVSVIRAMSARTTIVVATQSVEFVRWCQPEELVIANQSEHGGEFVRTRDRQDLADWLKDFNLGELWTMGELGGRR